MKLLIVVSIFLGEISYIYAEQLGAKLYRISGDFPHSFIQTLLPLAIGSVLLVGGYMLGLKYFNNIWIITVISLGSILLVEPAFDYFYLGQLPTFGAGLGFLLGVLGILCASFL